jgi:CubicO group peptidase (beta-lactamase class C family)
MRIRLLSVLAVALGVAPPVGLPLHAQGLPPDSTVRRIVTERLTSSPFRGIVVGLVDANGSRRVVAVGVPADRVFEIGSITKTFTSAILATMVADGSVRLDDPVAKVLPAAVRIPARNGRQITLLDLATQSSGLPRLPSNMAPRDSTNPYADYSVDQMYAFLSGYELPRDPGETYEYSNLGVGLLGHALALKAGVSYEELVRRRILAPLGMRETAITLSPALRARLAPGHDAEGNVVPNWDLPTLAGAGALRSTVGDMLTYVAAHLDSSANPLARALRQTHQSRRGAGSATMTIGLGWHILARPQGASIVWHNGGTGGYRSFAGFDEVRRVGVVVLTNANIGADDIGFHLLDATLPLQTPPKIRTEVAVDSMILNRYVGEYELVPTFHIVVTREGAGLFIQATGQPKFPIFAESASEFFLKVVDAQISFGGDGMVLHQNGQNLPGRKIR